MTRRTWTSCQERTTEKDLLELVSREIYISLSRLWRHVRHHIWPEHQVEQHVAPQIRRWLRVKTLHPDYTKITPVWLDVHPKIVPECSRGIPRPHSDQLCLSVRLLKKYMGMWKRCEQKHTVNHSHIRKPFSHTSQKHQARRPALAVAESFEPLLSCEKSRNFVRPQQELEDDEDVSGGPHLATPHKTGELCPQWWVSADRSENTQHCDVSKRHWCDMWWWNHLRFTWNSEPPNLSNTRTLLFAAFTLPDAQREILMWHATPSNTLRGQWQHMALHTPWPKTKHSGSARMLTFDGEWQDTSIHAVSVLSITMQIRLHEGCLSENSIPPTLEDSLQSFPYYLTGTLNMTKL